MCSVIVLYSLMDGVLLLFWASRRLKLLPFTLKFPSLTCLQILCDCSCIIRDIFSFLKSFMTMRILTAGHLFYFEVLQILSKSCYEEDTRRAIYCKVASTHPSAFARFWPQNGGCLLGADNFSCFLSIKQLDPIRKTLGQRGKGACSAVDVYSSF